MIDLHAHLLPDVDDGPALLDESLAILRVAAAAGTRTIAATPHVNRRYPTPRATMNEKLASLRQAVDEAGIAIDVVSGAEVALDQLSTLSIEQLSKLGLGGSSSVLIEFPFHGWPLDLISSLRALREAGLRPVLAHPERNDEIQRFPGTSRPARGRRRAGPGDRPVDQRLVRSRCRTGVLDAPGARPRPYASQRLTRDIRPRLWAS